MEDFLFNAIKISKRCYTNIKTYLFKKETTSLKSEVASFTM